MVQLDKPVFRVHSKVTLISSTAGGAQGHCCFPVVPFFLLKPFHSTPCDLSLIRFGTGLLSAWHCHKLKAVLRVKKKVLKEKAVWKSESAKKLTEKIHTFSQKKKKKDLDLEWTGLQAHYKSLEWNEKNSASCSFEGTSFRCSSHILRQTKVQRRTHAS